MSGTPPDPDEGEAVALGLTRPTMVGGFSLTALVMSFFAPVLIALMVRSPWMLCLIPPCLLVSYLVCLEDVYLFEIAFASVNLRACPNKKYWGCRSYAPR